MRDRWDRAITGFAVFQAVDAVGCATLDIIQDDLERLDCPPRVRRMLPFIKAASAAGLLLGRRWPRVARVTAAALSAYFVCALGFHARARDEWWRYAPAASLLVVSLVVALRPHDAEATPPTEEIVVSGEASAIVVDRREASIASG